MNSVKILHTADLHIGAAESFLGARAESRQVETLITFEKIINTARENSVQILLISGDLFNSNDVSKALIDRVFECFSSIPDIKIVYAAGNHDPLSLDSPFKKYKTPENVFVLETKDCFVEFSDLGTRVYGKSFKEVYMQGVARFSLDTDPDFINIMCIHGDLRSDLGSDYNSITSEFIQNSGMDYIALGHIHKRTDISKIGNTFLSYCGCPEGQGFDELGEKGVYLGTVSKGDCNLQFVPLAKRLHLCESIDISGVNSSAEISDIIINYLKQKYPDNYAENLYKIILTGEISEETVISTPEICSRLNSAVYFAKVKNQTQLKIDFELISREKTLKGIFVKNMLARIDSAEAQEKQKLKAALDLGLKAFSGEVAYDET
ncbi:MAG: DNA repair exonuclease [Clostridia bacterium]|nr:DNA repair exonuclease [Clostridia bacterium]